MAVHGRPGGGLGSNIGGHFRLPQQFLLGLLFLAFGILLILKLIGKDYVPFIPKEVFVWICAVGSVVGGFYLIVTQLIRPRIYV
jgi:hypothetical protein